MKISSSHMQPYPGILL